MTPDVIRKALEGYFMPLVKAEGGGVSVAMDFDDASEKLGSSNLRWHLVIGWDGYDSLEDGDMGDINSIAWSGYFFIVERSKGFGIKAGGDLAELEVLVGKVIAWIRAVSFEDGTGNCGGFEFRRSGWERVHSDQSWRRHEITARLLTALSAAPLVTLKV